MTKLSKKEKKLKDQRRQARRGLLERRRKRKFKHLKHTGQMGRYLARKQKLEGLQIKEVSKPKILKHKKLSLWERIKEFITILRKIFRR